MNVRTQLILGFGTVLAASGAIAIAATSALSSGAANLDLLVGERIPQMRRLSDITETIYNSALHIDDAIMAQTVAQVLAELEVTTANRKTTEENLAKIKTALSPGTQEELFAALLERRAPYAKKRDELIALAKAGRREEAQQGVEGLKPLRKGFLDALKALDVEVQGQARLEHDKAIARSVDAKKLIVVVGALALFFALGVMAWLIRAITRPLDAAVRVAARIAAGDLSSRLDADSADEFGRMGSALNDALAKIGAALGGISVNAGNLERSSGGLAKVSDSLSGSAAQAATQASTVATGSEQVGKSIQVVASSSQEMSVTIEEIAKSAAEAARVAGEGVSAVEETSRAIEKLGRSSSEIGAVVKLITSIAEQTNLLALNATIEAARAGAAGKGFAVVATEVKELAKETARATAEIGSKMQAIQGDAQGAVTAVAAIAGVVRRINELQASIAAAVEEQSAATREIGRSVTETATSSQDIARHIAGVATSVQATASGSVDVRAASVEMARMSGELRSLLAQFQTQRNQA